MEQFNSFETADGVLFHLGTVHFVACYKSSTNTPQTDTPSGMTAMTNQTEGEDNL